MTTVGTLKLFIGPMFSGKTLAAIREGERLECTTARVHWVVHAIDNRYDTNASSLSSHNRTSHDARGVTSLASLLLRSNEFDAVVVDELQFFEADDVFTSVTALLDEGKHVIAAGLDANYLRKPYAQVLQLVPLATRVEKLTAVCMYCRKAEAPHTVYLEKKHATEFVVGAADKYKAACGECYKRHSTH